MKLVYLIFLIGLLFYSCNKEEKEANENEFKSDYSENWTFYRINHVVDYMYVPTQNGTQLVNNSHDDTLSVTQGIIEYAEGGTKIRVKFDLTSSSYAILNVSNEQLSCVDCANSVYNSASTGSLTATNFLHDLDEWAHNYSGSYYVTPRVYGVKN